jgi:hypothetical protein
MDLNWSCIQAVDILALLSSFIPITGKILCVSIYFSNYGIAQIKESHIKGPCIQSKYETIKMIENNYSTSETETPYLHDDNLRKNSSVCEQSNSRWYYAIAEFGDDRTADVVYASCQGLMFNQSNKPLYLRFVPGYEDFSKLRVSDKATEVPSSYMAPTFETCIHTKKIWNVIKIEGDKTRTCRQTRTNMNAANPISYKPSDNKFMKKENSTKSLNRLVSTRHSYEQLNNENKISNKKSLLEIEFDPFFQNKTSLTFGNNRFDTKKKNNTPSPNNPFNISNSKSEKKTESKNIIDHNDQHFKKPCTSLNFTLHRTTYRSKISDVTKLPSKQTYARNICNPRFNQNYYKKRSDQQWTKIRAAIFNLKQKSTK